MGWSFAMEVCAYVGNQLVGLYVTSFACFVQLLRASPDNYSNMQVCSVGARELSCGSRRAYRGADLLE